MEVTNCINQKLQYIKINEVNKQGSQSTTTTGKRPIEESFDTSNTLMNKLYLWDQLNKQNSKAMKMKQILLRTLLSFPNA